jgi:uncharacterized OB-fold protein
MPYVIAYVELPDGVQVFAQIVDIEPVKVTIGMKVELDIRCIRRDERAEVDIVAYVFRPASAT